MKTYLYKTYDAFNCVPKEQKRTDDAFAIIDAGEVDVYVSSAHPDVIHIEVDGLNKIFITCRKVNLHDMAANLEEGQ